MHTDTPLEQYLTYAVSSEGLPHLPVVTIPTNPMSGSETNADVRLDALPDHARHTGVHGRHDRGRHLGQPERSIFLPPSGGFYFLWYPQSQYGPPDANVYCRMNSLPPPASFMV